MNGLNERQIDLYNYLLKNGDQWIKQKDVAYALFSWYRFMDDNFHDSRARVIMTKDIQAINNNESVPKIIISSPSGIKLANEYEFNRYIKSEYRTVFNKLKRVRAKERKGRLNGQARFLFQTDQDVIEAFLHDI